ncbi:MAG TPA: 4-phosphoerythronate dehydrogenase [Pseudomonadales bacterium]|nr:4-phosphoerythronate dehydrogenase [Pseudomonadales bacterium]
MRLLCDENLLGARALFGPMGELRMRPGRDIDGADVAWADALLLRSQTRVDAALLGAARPRFVGTATAGSEHVDVALLERLGIPFANAPGCNAESVADWVVAACTLALREGSLPATGVRAAVIGCGAIGGRVVGRLQALGMDVGVCDPPLRAAAPHRALPWIDLDEALSCDLVTLHVPLVETGPHATRHLLDARAIERLAPGTVLLNAARGGVVDDAALAARLDARADLFVALDVYEDEPDAAIGLRERCRIVTPHVAGHSLDGKAQGTAMIHAALCRVLGRRPLEDLGSVLPPPAPAIEVGDDLQAARALVLRACDLEADDAALRATLALPAAARRAAFDRLRRDYPPRRDFRELAVRAEGAAARFCAAAGMRVLGSG